MMLGREVRVEITVLLFASLRDDLGSSSIQLEVPQSTITVEELLKLVKERFPVLRRRLGAVRVAVNQEFRNGPESIPERAEVALIPPVSGG